MRNALAMVGLGAVVLAVALALVGVAGDTRAGAETFPKMANATYIKKALDNRGAGTGSERSIILTCDAGDKVLSGGFDELDKGSQLSTNGPTSGDTARPHNRWEVQWYHDGSDDAVDVFVLCADFPPTR